MCSFIMTLKRSGPNSVIVCLVSGVSFRNVSSMSAHCVEVGLCGKSRSQAVNQSWHWTPAAFPHCRYSFISTAQCTHAHTNKKGE